MNCCWTAVYVSWTSFSSFSRCCSRRSRWRCRWVEASSSLTSSRASCCRLCNTRRLTCLWLLLLNVYLLCDNRLQLLLSLVFVFAIIFVKIPTVKRVGFLNFNIIIIQKTSVVDPYSFFYKSGSGFSASWRLIRVGVRIRIRVRTEPIRIRSFKALTIGEKTIALNFYSIYFILTTVVTNLWASIKYFTVIEGLPALKKKTIPRFET